MMMKIENKPRIMLCMFGSLALATADSLYKIRSRHDANAEQVMSERRRKLLELDLTFSSDGDPTELPQFQLQLFPTTKSLDSTSEMILETALQDYLTSFFERKYPSNFNEDTATEESLNEAAPYFRSALVDIVESTTIFSTDTRRRRLQREGTALDIITTLRFADGIFPEYDQLQSDMQLAMFSNFDVFLKDYLPVYAGGYYPELEAIDSGKYVPGFTSPPTASPTSSTPRGTVSQANNQLQNNENGKGSGAGYVLFAAVGAGVLMFIITALVLSSRRRRAQANRKVRYLDEGSNVGHVSIDFDGRQEAVDLERERQQEAYAQREIARRLRASKDDEWQRERMPDGRTTVYIAKQDPPPSGESMSVDSSDQGEMNSLRHTQGQRKSWRYKVGNIRATSPTHARFGEGEI
jgi:hypothetical protein